MDLEVEMLNILLKNFTQEARCKNYRLDLIGVTPPERTKNLQSTKETLEEAAALSKEVDKAKEAMDINHSLREDIDHFVFSETMKDLITSSSSSSIISERNNNKEIIDIENSLRDAIDHVVISEIMKDFIKFSSTTPTTCLNTENSDDEVQQEDMTLTKLSESFLDVEMMISCRTNANNKRLEDLNHQFDLMKEEIILLKRKELLYRNAFVRRCYDLQTAEAEVDLLGDEVEFLLGLIKKSYEVLDHYLPDLQYHSEVEVKEIINLLKTEVEAEFQHPSNNEKFANSTTKVNMDN